MPSPPTANPFAPPVAALRQAGPTKPAGDPSLWDVARTWAKYHWSFNLVAVAWLVVIWGPGSSPTPHAAFSDFIVAIAVLINLSFIIGPFAAHAARWGRWGGRVAATLGVVGAVLISACAVLTLLRPA